MLIKSGKRLSLLKSPPLAETAARKQPVLDTNNSRPLLRPEIEVVLCCARTTLSDQDNKRLQRLLASGIDWSRLVSISSQYRVLPLVYWNLSCAGGDTVPTDILDRLRQQYFENAAHNLLLAKTLANLLDLFVAQRLPAIPYKGIMIAQMAYGSLASRQMSDLDILVRERDYPRAQRLLQSQGLHFAMDWGWECTWVDDTGHIHIDLHRAVTADSFPLRAGFRYWYRRLVPVLLAERRLSGLSPTDSLILTSIQIAKDGWFQGCRLHKICDIAELLRAYPSIDGSQLLKDADALGCRRVLLLAIQLAHTLLDAPLPHGLSAQLLASTQIKTLSKHVFLGLFDTNDYLQPTATGRLSRRAYYLAVRERWIDRITPHYQPFIRRIFAPNVRDRAFLTLPDTLWFLYYLVRPVRLFRDYGLRIYKYFGTARPNRSAVINAEPDAHARATEAKRR